MRMFAAIWTAINLATIAPAFSAGCETITFEDVPFTVCEADPESDDVRLMLNADDGEKIGTFSRAEVEVSSENQQIVFAMNAGMYHPNREPVGLYIEDGEEVMRIITNDGPGNFGLLPNGVFCLSGDTAAIIESRTFAANPPACQYATQSGPMLVIEGELHPRFLVNSDSFNIRNGVGVTTDGSIVTAISDRAVTFHQFGRLFRDVLNTPNALFLDGRVSKLYAPDLDRRDIGFPMGPMLVVTRPAD